MKTISYVKKEMTPLRPEENKSHPNITNCYLCEEEFGDDNNVN